MANSKAKGEGVVDEDRHPEEDLPEPLLKTLAALGNEATLTPHATISPLRLAAAETMAAGGGFAGAPMKGVGDVARLPALSLPHLTIGQVGAAAPGAVRPDLALTGLLGQGGMGRVELARQHSLGRDVAVKTVRPDRVTEAAVAALLQEARFTGSLEHPNIIPVHALGRNDEGLPLLVMKRVQGVGWHELLRNPVHAHWRGVRGDPLVRNLEILMQVCNAVHFAHTRGVVHRDLKPENVMVGEFGEVYVLDWGLAVDLKAEDSARSVELAGTPSYMAPEMLHGETWVTPRTDVFLLGAILHEVLTGRPRHEGTTLRDVLRAVAEVRPYAYGPSVPEELAALANRATSADPDERPSDAMVFREALVDVLAHRGSIELMEEASQRLDTLRALLAGPADEERRQEIHKLATECRFGFRQALRIWEGNERARAGLEACLVALIEYELDRQNPGAAEALLNELPTPQPALQARLEALRERRRAEVRASAELARLAHEHDPGVSARQRVRALTLVALAGAGISSYLALGGHAADRTSTPKQLATFGGIILGVGLVGCFLARRALLATRLNRQVTLFFLTTVAAVFAHRLLGMALDMQVPHLLLGDLMLLIVSSILGAGMINGRTLWLVCLPLTAVVATVLMPQRSLQIFEVTGLSMIVGILLSQLGLQRDDREGGGGVRSR
ncbi:MAG TPA: serine/threonine-protein kinase [Polyangia bacterium]|nr:serine/threonine-protein kinase [Polyangia bacterium]